MFRSGFGCLARIILIIIAIVIVILLGIYLSSHHFWDSLFSMKGEIDNLIQSTVNA